MTKEYRELYTEIEYRQLYTEIVKKIFTKKRISIVEIDKLIDFAFNEGYNQCMLNEVKGIKNERKIDE